MSRDDRNTLIAIASGDILAVIPVILPYLLPGFRKTPLGLSRLIASLAIGYICYLYAEHTGRNKWLSAGIFVIFTIVVCKSPAASAGDQAQKKVNFRFCSQIMGEPRMTVLCRAAGSRAIPVR